MRRGLDFEEFLRSASPALLRTAFLLCGDRGHAEDLLQFALLRTARRWATASDNPTGYIRTVLTNLVKDRWRERSRPVAETPLGETDDPGVEDADTTLLLQRDSLMHTLNQLPPGQRAVLVLRYLDDLPIDEVARLLGCSAGSVKSQTHHALVRLRTLIATSWLCQRWLASPGPVVSELRGSTSTRSARNVSAS